MENYKNSKIGLETAQKYGDILEMERPQTEESLRKHPRMTLQNRAKIFSPFSPLRGYDEQLAAEKQRTERVTKRILTEEEMSALSDRLCRIVRLGDLRERKKRPHLVENQTLKSLKELFK